MAKGDRFASEARVYEGERALKPTWQLTANGGQNRHMPFHAPTFAGEGARLIYISDRSGSQNFYRMNLGTFESIELTEGYGIFAAGAWYSEGAREIFYWEKAVLKAVNFDTLEERVVYDEGYQGGCVSVSCDGRFAAFGARCEDVAGFSEEFNGRHVLMVVSTRGEGAHPAAVLPFEISRVQFSPTEPEKVLFSWEGEGQVVPQRAWYCDVDGLDGGPMGVQKPNEARFDEYFTPQGDYISYHGTRYHVRNSEGEYMVEETGWTLGLVQTDGKGEVQFECAGPTGQCQINGEQSLLVCSQGGAMEKNHQSVALVRLLNEKGIFDPLFYHGCEAHSQWVGPRFRPGAEEVVFTSDFSGRSHIYMVSLN